MNKPWYKSKTAWGAVLVGGGMVLSSIGGFLLDDIDAAAALMRCVAGIGAILVAVGLRDAIEKKQL